MNAFSRDGQWERAVSLLDEIETRNVVATVISPMRPSSPRARSGAGEALRGFSGGKDFPAAAAKKRQSS